MFEIFVKKIKIGDEELFTHNFNRKFSLHI